MMNYLTRGLINGLFKTHPNFKCFHKIDILCTRVNRVNQIMKQMRYNIIRYTIRFKVYRMI